MADSYKDDLAKYRTPGSTYTIESKQGRNTEGRDKAKTTVMVVGTTVSDLPENPLGRRSFIRVKNLDSSNSVYILTEEDVTLVSGTVASGTTVSGADVGYELSPELEWEDETDAAFWVISSAGAVNISVYERSSR